MLFGCKARPEPTITRTETVTVREELRDTIVKIESDTAYLTLRVDCDETSRVTEANRSDGVRTSMAWKVRNDGNGDRVIDIECKSDSLEREIAIRDTIIETLRQERQVVTVPRRRNWIETTMIIIGSVSVAFLFALIGYKLYKLIRLRR